MKIKALPQFVFLVLLCCNCYTQNNNSVWLYRDSIRSLTEHYLKINPEASGAISAIAIPGDSLWKHSTGFVGIGKKKGLSGNEPFIAASITKTFVAVCILQLEEEGLLSLKDKVIKYLDPNTIRKLTMHKGKSSENEVTIEQLLRHTSGIFDYLNQGKVHLDGYKNAPDKTYSLQDRVDFALNEGSATKFGKYNYSNTNYILLGMIAEKVDNANISEILNKRVIHQLNLKNTSLAPNKNSISKMFKGYYTDWDLTSFTFHFNKMNPAGGILTTVEDLLLFGKGVFSGKLFKLETTLEKMLDFKKGYGLGVMQFDKNPKTGRVIGHSGFDPGYTSYLAYLEKPGITVVTVINQSELRVIQPAFLIVKLVHYLKGNL